MDSEPYAYLPVIKTYRTPTGEEASVFGVLAVPISEVLIVKELMRKRTLQTTDYRIRWELPLSYFEGMEYVDFSFDFNNDPLDDLISLEYTYYHNV